MKYFFIVSLVFIFSSNIEARKYRTKKREKKQTEKVIKKIEKKKGLYHKAIKKSKLNIPIDIQVTYVKEEEDEIEVFVFLHYATFMAQDWHTEQMILKKGVYHSTIPSDYVLKGGVVYYIQVVDEF